MVPWVVTWGITVRMNTGNKKGIWYIETFVVFWSNYLQFFFLWLLKILMWAVVVLHNFTAHCSTFVFLVLTGLCVFSPHTNLVRYFRFTTSPSSTVLPVLTSWPRFMLLEFVHCRFHATTVPWFIYLPLNAVHDLVVWVMALQARTMFCLDIRTSDVFYSFKCYSYGQEPFSSLISHVIFLSLARFTSYLEQLCFSFVSIRCYS
jgi:hypothetical protein